MMSQSLTKIALLGNYLPRQCGIATFTHDLREVLSSSNTECFVVAMNDSQKSYSYPPEVRFEIAEQNLPNYRRAADFLNFIKPDVLCVQHEFGIYGGAAGSHLLEILRRVKIPVVTQLHTILEKPTAEQRRVTQAIASLSKRIIVMSKRGERMLGEIYKVPADQIDLIPHGIPDVPFVDPKNYKSRFGVEGKRVLLTFGLISPGKGLEYVIRALPDVLKVFPDLVYIVVGATHPNLLREEGENYRLSLERLATEVGVNQQIIFHNHFVQIEDLLQFFAAADVYITPYLNANQITSGTLACSFGCGKAIISTPYWHAEELLADGRGILVPFRDSDAIARELVSLLKDDRRRQAMRQEAYLLGREMIWSKVARLFLSSFKRARLSNQEELPGRLALRSEGKPKVNRKILPVLEGAALVSLPEVRVIENRLEPC